LKSEYGNNVMKPGNNDYDSYYKTYVDKVVWDDPAEAMEKYLEEHESFLKTIPLEISGLPYGEGKWSYKETLGHIIDTERVMAYRALSIARGEIKPLPGFDQDLYVKNGSFNNREFGEMIEEYSVVRRSSLILFRSFTPEDMSKRGIANESEVTVLALGFIIAGHDRHHYGVLREYFQRNL
jgi:hypothetical protein